MPPKINIQRANIAPEFIELMIDLYKEWVVKNERIIRQSIGNPRHEHFAHSGRRMLQIAKRQSPSPRAGLDYEITRLRGLPYDKFYVVEEPSPTNPDEVIPWLAGHTRFVTMTNHANRKEVMGHMGCYTIFIPSTIVEYPSIDSIHMVPDRNHLSRNRHPHHYLNVTPDMQLTLSPLAYPTGNCFGDYSGVIKGMIDEPDFPELFRQLYGHLCTYGILPPRHLDDLDFDITTPER